MAKFLNKKEQVYDLKLTSYGRHLLSTGKFKPVYYTFYDDNVLYDAQYAGLFERQNDAHKRIKEDTPYIESLVLFEDVENLTDDASIGEINFFSNDVTAIQKTPRKDSFRFSVPIGDGHISGEPQRAPVWKIALLQGQISSSAEYDTSNNIDIPQIDIDVIYKKKTIDWNINYKADSFRELTEQTAEFKDKKTVALMRQDLVFYIEELNTDLLVENFDIEMYHVTTGSDDSGQIVTELQRKYFKTFKPQIIDGLLVLQQPGIPEETTGLSETDFADYYFNVMVDNGVEQSLACKGADYFNKESYYIDLEFQCDQEAVEELYYDIYGTETEPETC